MSKNFMELVSSDEKVKVEVLAEGLKALQALAVEKGFKDDAIKALSASLDKAAEAHGFKTDEPEELDIDQLEEVAGGKMGFDCFISWGTNDGDCRSIVGYDCRGIVGYGC